MIFGWKARPTGRLVRPLFDRDVTRMFDNIQQELLASFWYLDECRFHFNELLERELIRYNAQCGRTPDGDARARAEDRIHGLSRACSLLDVMLEADHDLAEAIGRLQAWQTAEKAG